MSSTPAVESLADLLCQLGNVPTARIWARPAPGTATEQDVLLAHGRQKRLCELVDGVLVEKPMGFYESRLAAVLIHLLETYLEQHKLGIVLGADGMVRLAEGLVRIPDVSFVSWSRLPDGKLPLEPIPDLAPDLVVEILSQSNTRSEIDRKLDEYFQAGVQLTWIMDPESQTVRTYRQRNECELIDENGSLDGGDVLPGLSLSIRDWFSRAGQRH